MPRRAQFPAVRRGECLHSMQHIHEQLHRIHPELTVHVSILASRTESRCHEVGNPTELKGTSMPVSR